MKKEIPGVNYFRHALPGSRFGMDLKTQIENRQKLEHVIRRVQVDPISIQKARAPRKK